MYNYHIDADDTQLSISFNLKTCNSDVRVLIINDKLKINDKKTESPMLKYYFDISDYIGQFVMMKYHHHQLLRTLEQI